MTGTPSDTPLLEAYRLAITAGGVRLCENITFTVQAGERVAVVGPSGSGKTTLLRALCGLEDAVEGTVRLQGKMPEEWTWPLFRRRVILVEQKPALLDETVEEALRRPFQYRAAANAPFPEARARELLHRLTVGADRMTQAARALSVGQQQRVCLVRALLLNPLVLLLDEPTSALDTEAIAAVEVLLNDEGATRGLAALIVTHDSRQAQEWCHRRLDLRTFALENTP